MYPLEVRDLGDHLLDLAGDIRDWAVELSGLSNQLIIDPPLPPGMFHYL
jgi:hypothetical protein